MSVGLRFSDRQQYSSSRPAPFLWAHGGSFDFALFCWIIYLESDATSRYTLERNFDSFVRSGSFDAGMHALRSRGLDAALHTAVHERGAPLLGICLGMQLLARRSEEGEAAGLGWIDADVVRFAPQPRLRIPHMGWNSVQPQSPSPLFDAADADPEFYFVHSFHVVPDDPALVTGAATHGGPFAAAVGRGRIHGVQFHPEKSHRHGLQLLRRFLEAA